jgi:AmmeMemoRadiSam system protein A
MALSDETKRGLLTLARRTIETRVRENRVPGANDLAGLADNEETAEERGSFVSLHIHRDLRGCIGNIAAVGSLRESVIRNAVSAATRDPRFGAVQEGELPVLEIEVSALTRLEETTPDAIRIGEHGLYLVSGGHHGVLLPQVATEYGWQVEEFLEHTAMKAGLSPDAWQRARLYRFGAEVFSEKGMGRNG